MEGLIPGRIVHYVLPRFEHRAAIVTNVLSSRKGIINLQVFMDGDTDLEYRIPGVETDLMWATERQYSENYEPGTWHWIERA